MQPILFQIDTAIVSSYSFMLSLSFVLGSLLFVALLRSQNISINKLFGLIILIQVSAIVGSRFLYVVNNYEQFESDFVNVFSISPGGFALNGGLFFVVFLSFLYIKLNKLSFWNISDYAAPPLAIGITITKIGCFLAGCCYGTETSLAWGVQFPAQSIPTQHYGISHQIHPAQLYEAMSGIFFIIALLIIFKRRKFEGQMFLLFIMSYLGVRILNDFVRGDAVNNYFFSLSQTQFLSVVFLLIALVFYWLQSRSIKISLSSKTLLYIEDRKNRIKRVTKIQY